MTSSLKGQKHTHTDDVSGWYTFKTGTDEKYCLKIHLIQDHMNGIMLCQESTCIN